MKVVSLNYDAPGERKHEHAAYHLLWVTGYDNRILRIGQFMGNGFYWLDETEVYITGPYSRIVDAIKDRDEYFARL